MVNYRTEYTEKYHEHTAVIITNNIFKYRLGITKIPVESFIKVSDLNY